MEAHAQKHEATISKGQTERKTVFLRRLGHELRNPLQGIKGNLDLLMEELNDLKQLVKKQQNGNNKNVSTDNKEKKNDLLDIHQIQQRIDNALEYAESAYLATEHQMLVINETLSLARLESEQDGLETFNPQSVDMNDIIRQVHAIMGVKAFEKGIDVQYHIVSDQAKHVCTDPCWLKQILINLISNAIKFTFRGNVIITIDTCQTSTTETNNKESRSCDSNQKSCNNKNIALKVTVKDDGIGMTAAEQKKLFSVFVQANENIGTEYGGSGLGLNIIRQMLGHIGGSIQIVESIKDVGSTFQFIMPCEKVNNDEVQNNNDLIDDEPSTNISYLLEEDLQDNLSVNTTTTDSVEATVASTSGKHQSVVPLDETKVLLSLSSHIEKVSYNVRILIVDDSSMNLKILSNFLRKNGYTNHEMAQHGKQAYEMHQNNPYDLIITDIDMPFMDGLELTKQIRNREKMIMLDYGSDVAHKLVPIFGISGNVLPEDSALATEVGMNEYVGKPYHFPMIEALIAKHVFLNDNVCYNNNVIVTS